MWLFWLVLDWILSFVVGHDFHRGDEICESQSLVIVAVVAAHPAIKIVIVDVRSTVKVEQECPKIITSDFAVTEFVNSSENG